MQKFTNLAGKLKRLLCSNIYNLEQKLRTQVNFVQPYLNFVYI